MKRLIFSVSVIACTTLTALGSASAATCGNSAAGFSSWRTQFFREAKAKGISAGTLNRALSGVTYDRNVIRLDRNQKSFKLSFQQFYRRRVNKSMINRGRALMRRHAGLFNRIEKRYGVPRQIITAIWGLETAYGRIQGRKPVFRSLATLAYDCRRSAFFTKELMSALRIVQRGDMSPKAMRGAWAGEIGQTQFLASNYLKFAVDFDGNGRRDLVRSVPDVLASTANFLKRHGWQRGGSWGPGTANHAVLTDWNRAGVYRKTIARMASQMGG